MPFAPVNGIDLYYEVHGSGPALLFAHGQGGNHLSWWQQIPLFCRYYTCITFDNRAFGFSLDRDGRGRTAFAADVIGLLDHLDVQDVRVVAHSMGGRSAASVVRSDRCRALVLGGTNGGVSNDAIRQRQREAAEARGGRGLGAFSVAPGYGDSNPDMMFLLRSISRLNPPRPRDFLHLPVPPPPPGTPPSPPRVPIHERLAANRTPVLYIVGQHDEITPPDEIEMCHRLVPDSRFVVVPGAGHSAYFEKADFYNDAVRSFLEDVDGPAVFNEK